MGKNRKLDYFDAFEKQAEAAVAEAELLIKTIDNFADLDSVRKHMERAHDLENEADRYIHATYKHLAHDFITPIDREDIIAMAQNLDNIVDYIEDVVRCFYMYDIHEMHDDAREFAQLIKKSCKALHKAMGDFRDFKKSKTFKQLIIDVNANEEEADRLYLRVTRTLYTKGRDDSLRVIVWSQVFDRMEKCCDACEHAADTMSTIMLKNV